MQRSIAIEVRGIFTIWVHETLGTIVYQGPDLVMDHGIAKDICEFVFCVPYIY